MTYITKPKVHHPSLQKNAIGLTRRDYEGSITTLCAGCGHDSITAAIIQAFWELSIAPHTVAKLSLSVNLPHQSKGTHMSRFIEVLNEHRGEMTMRTLPVVLQELRRRLDAEAAHVDVKFPYFLEKTAPQSGAKALMDYACVSSCI